MIPCDFNACDFNAYDTKFGTFGNKKQCLSSEIFQKVMKLEVKIALHFEIK